MTCGKVSGRNFPPHSLRVHVSKLGACAEREITTLEFKDEK